MSEKEFKVGDWVVVKLEEVQFVGIITNKTELGYEVKDNNHYYQFVLEQYLERIDPKTAFLTELSELLRKYDAGINASWDEYYDDDCPKIDIDVIFNGSVEGICFENMLGKALTADNVLNYDK